ncbi:hypothetical protein HanRHA438_Chr02g0051321 [Helianthus annuus]|nr:hypothetical protein HanRHA438_Chr02g0051321 [Helianthus annuus]
MRAFHMVANTNCTFDIRAFVIAFAFMLDISLSLNESFFHVYLLNKSSSVINGIKMGRTPRAGNKEDEMKPGVVNLISFSSRFIAAHSFTNVHSVDVSTTLCVALTPSATPPHSKVVN